MSQAPKTMMSSSEAGKINGSAQPGASASPGANPPSGDQVSKLSPARQLPTIKTLPSGMVRADDIARLTDMMPDAENECEAGL